MLEYSLNSPEPDPEEEVKHVYVGWEVESVMSRIISYGKAINEVSIKKWREMKCIYT